MKKIIQFIFAIAIGLSAYTQENLNTVNKHLLKANLLFSPSLTYEFGFNRSSTFKFEIGTALTVFDNFDETKVGFFPKYESQYKFYYNLKKRNEKGKNIEGNSANFVALIGQYQGDKDLFGETERLSEFLFVGPAWGFQRSYKSGLSLLFEIGFGYDFSFKDDTNDNGRPFPVIGFELGWVIFKK